MSSEEAEMLEKLQHKSDHTIFSEENFPKLVQSGPKFLTKYEKN
jgi:hypothetical protein